MRRLLGILATAIMISVTLITLVGLLSGVALFESIASFLLQLAVITIAVTIVMGVINLLAVHVGRVFRRGRGWVYSLALIAALLIVIVLWATGQRENNAVLLNTIQVSVEASLGGLILFALVFGAVRLMRRRVTAPAMLFTVVVIVVLVGALPLASVAPIAVVREWLLAVPVSAGARGLLIGIALATVVTGIRVLIGQERASRD